MAVIRSRRVRSQEAITVEAWGPEPIGAAQVDALQARHGADLAGAQISTPPGWGASGSVEATDTTVWMPPQAFNGLAGLSALSTFIPGGGIPQVDTASGHAELVFTRPGPGGL